MTFTLFNGGRTPVRVAHVRNATPTEGVVFTTVPVSELPHAAQVRGLDYVVWQVLFSAVGPDDRDVEFVTTVKAVGADPASASFTLRATPSPLRPAK